MAWTTTPIKTYVIDYAGKYQLKRIFPLWWEIMDYSGDTATRRCRQILLARAKAELHQIIYLDLMHEVERVASYVTELENEVLAQSEASARDITQQDNLGPKQAKLRHYKELERGIEGLMADVWINGVDHLEVTGEESYGFTRLSETEFRPEDPVGSGE